MSAPLVFEKSVCFGYQTRVFSVTRDAGTVKATRSRKQKDIQEVIDPRHVGNFGRLKQEAFRLCRAHGTKLELLDVWIVPEEAEAVLDKKLIDISLRWDEYRDNTLVPNYDDWVEEHARDNPAEASDIRRLAPTVAEIKRQTRFVFASFRLNPGQIKAINLDEEMGGLPSQAVREIASEIKDAGMDKSASFTQQSRDVLKRITRKAKSLAYLHPRLKQIADTIDALNSSLPPVGSIRGIDALAVRSVLDSLLNPSRFMERGFGTGDDDQLELEVAPGADDLAPLNEEIAANVEPDLFDEPEQIAEADKALATSDWDW